MLAPRLLVRPDLVPRAVLAGLASTRSARPRVPSRPLRPLQSGPADGYTERDIDRADAIAPLIVVGLMLHAAWGLLAETGQILLEAAPEGYAPSEIITAITSQPGVASVRDVPVWLITSGFPALSAHVLVHPPADCHQVGRALEQLPCERSALDHTTLQVDQAPDELLTIDGGTR